jgi:hypothetical protein
MKWFRDRGRNPGTALEGARLKLFRLSFQPLGLLKQSESVLRIVDGIQKRLGLDHRNDVFHEGLVEIFGADRDEIDVVLRQDFAAERGSARMPDAIA